MVNDYLEIQAGLPDGKQSSWEVCSVHSPSGWRGLALREQQGCRYLGVLGFAWVVWVLVRELGVNSKRLSLTKEHKHEAVLPN